MSYSQPWIASARFDSLYILSPALIITLIVIFLHPQLASLSDIPPWLWLILIISVDVSHVYSTLFRTYLDKDEWQRHSKLFVLTPVLAWVIGCILYSINTMLFWRVLAYLAVFHFIRQHYGFMMIYARKERDVPPYYRTLDKAAIYGATLYPLFYWHCHKREFAWFIEGDFFSFNTPLLSNLAAILYVAIMIAYLLKEAWQWKRIGMVNIPKNLLLFGTAVSWYVGIIAFDNDLAFTATNVIAHGIPYFALIWLYGHNKISINNNKKNNYVVPWITTLFQRRAIPLYIGALFMLAYVEEGLWDALIWREHSTFFGFLHILPALTDITTLTWVIPLLAVPQATHYILDAFIWRMHMQGTEWKHILFYQQTRGAS
jgi:hypothetical protein